MQLVSPQKTYHHDGLMTQRGREWTHAARLNGTSVSSLAEEYLPVGFLFRLRLPFQPKHWFDAALHNMCSTGLSSQTQETILAL
jgi:hypothetical protein